MSFFQKTALTTAVIAAGFTAMLAASGTASAAASTSLTTGDKCTVISGPNKGKTGTYGSDGWCEGNWGGTECGSTKCKIVAKSAATVNASTSNPAPTRATQFKMKRMSTSGSTLFTK